MREDPHIKYFQYILNVIAFISSKWASWVSNVSSCSTFMCTITQTGNEPEACENNNPRYFF